MQVAKQHVERGASKYDTSTTRHVYMYTSKYISQHIYGGQAFEIEITSSAMFVWLADHRCSPPRAPTIRRYAGIFAVDIHIHSMGLFIKLSVRYSFSQRLF